MNKPITVAKAEFETALVELVNNSGLPAFAVKVSMQNLLKAVEDLENQQLQEDMTLWEQEQETREEVTNDNADNNAE